MDTLNEMLEPENQMTATDCMEMDPRPSEAGVGPVNSFDEDMQPIAHRISNSDEASCDAPDTLQQSGSDKIALELGEQGRQRSAAKLQKGRLAEKKCQCCGTQNTPVWRWGGDSKDTLLCNACSLRIRRSNARPQTRTKASGDRPQKKQNVAAGKLVGSAEPSTSSLSQEEIDALRQRLAGFMCQEKARLLGTSDSPNSDSDRWEVPSGWVVSPSSQSLPLAMPQPLPFSPSEWQPAEYSSLPHAFMGRGPPAAQWAMGPQQIPAQFPQELPLWDHLHDQELAHIYAQTTAL